MSFRKFIFKHGFGSVGFNAKGWSKNYLKLISPGYSKDQAINSLIVSYALANQKFTSYNVTDPSLIFLKSDKCLAFVIWMLICDIPSTIPALLFNEEALQDAVEAVYEAVTSILPGEVRNNDYEFYKKAKEYVNYRDNVLKVLESNSLVYNPLYKVFIISKTDGIRHKYEFENYSEAKEEYLNSIAEFDSEAYLTELIEKNDDKYVYVHDSTDNASQKSMNEQVKIYRGRLQLTGID